jgi:DNA-binding response OmpR family regulator/signal transduction histidine kinase
MVLQRRVIGVVDLESRYPQAYSPTEERLLVALANHAALAVENLHLVDETRKVAALRELDRMKTELLGTVSHELRTPLGSIKGYATTLLTYGNKLKRDEQREFLEIIDSEADRLRELIENLLDMSRLEAGVLRIDREPTRLGEIARDVVRKVQLATPTTRSRSTRLAPVDPLVAADSRRIYQVIQNLLTNAVKYSPDGGTIALAGRQERHDLMVSVQDQGLGMPANELDRIFDRFHRVSGDLARQKIGGTGLGLAICKGLVDAHGGRIWAESEGDSKGSVFKFTLPLLPMQEVSGSKVSMTTKKQTVLVADDDPRLLKLIQRNLELENYRVVTVSDGPSVLRQAEAEEPDLYVLDIMMPGLDGREVTRRLREFSIAPVLMLTAKDTEDDKVAGLEAGADDYLTKPFGLGELLARIRVALRHARQRAAGSLDEPFESGPLRVDLAARKVLLDGNEVHLTPVEYKLLATLVRHAGRVVTHNQLLQAVWGPQSAGETQYLRVYMTHLRRKLEPGPSSPRYVIHPPRHRLQPGPPGRERHHLSPHHAGSQRHRPTVTPTCRAVTVSQRGQLRIKQDHEPALYHPT